MRYCGYYVEPIHDPEETGAWPECSIEKATHFRVYPPDEARPCFDSEITSLQQAYDAIDADIKEQQ